MLVGTAVVMSADLIQRTPVAAPRAADTGQTSERERHRSASPCHITDSSTTGLLHMDVLGALVQSAHSPAVVEGHAAGGDGHETKHQRHGEDHVIWRKIVQRTLQTLSAHPSILRS